MTAQNRVKVLMIAPRDTHPGGITRALEAWHAAGLTEHVDVDAVSMSAWDDPLLVQLLQSAIGLIKLASRLARPSRRPDVVHIHVSSGGSLYRKYLASRLVRSARIPILVHLHSGGLEAWVATRRIHRATAERLVCSASGVVVIAEVWRALALELGARRVYFVPHLLPPRLAQLLANAAMDRDLGRGPSEQPTILYYGRWAPIKGLDVLAAAVRKLPLHHQRRLRVRLFGNGDIAWVRQCFRDAAVADLTIGGWLTDDQKPRELSGADAVVLPSRSEGFGASLLEAMAAATPIIASDTGAIPEVLADYPVARLIRPDDSDDLRDALAALLDGHWPDRPAVTPSLPDRYAAIRVISALVDAYRLTFQRAGESGRARRGAHAVQSQG